MEPGTPGGPRCVPNDIGEAQRLPMYIVISKPKRISVKSGLVHMFPSSGTIVVLVFHAGATCTGAATVGNCRAILALPVPKPVAVRFYSTS